MVRLGVNVDHVATLREARGGTEPDPVLAALVCEKAGCDSIVAHLREDHRHINDADIARLKKNVSKLNLEMSINKDIVKKAVAVKPWQATLVPEKRRELTTEGGLDIRKYKKAIAMTIKALKKSGIEVSLFIDPDKPRIREAKSIGVNIIEIHTGRYSLVTRKSSIEREFRKIKEAVDYALSLGLTVNAGHGLNYSNVKRVAKIEGINELNIGHSIMSYAVFAGLRKAVKDMRALIG